MAGNEQSRRDDIESIGYMIIFFMKKRVPWQGIKYRTHEESYHKQFLIKKNIKTEELCKGLPREMAEYMNIAKSMKFEQEPDYKYLKDLFRTILKKIT
jgi:casein kinase I family protein HRR25